MFLPLSFHGEPERDTVLKPLSHNSQKKVSISILLFCTPELCLNFYLAFYLNLEVELDVKIYLPGDISSQK